jgi:hypothetical protein
MNQVNTKKSTWSTATFDGTYLNAKQKYLEFVQYKNTEKRLWVAGKRDLDTLLGNIQTKLKTYDLQPYYPPKGLTLNDLDSVWQSLLDAETKRYRSINDKLRE